MSFLYTLAIEAARRVEERTNISEHPHQTHPSYHKQAMTLTDFSDDILHQIYAFIPTIQNLRNVAYVNKRASQWILESKTTDPLFGAAYKLAFDDKPATNDRKAWKDLFEIRQCLSRGMYGVIPAQLRTVGVLPPERESEAVGYDHPRSHFQDGQCLGYFGMARLFPQGDGPLAIWGDFDGIYMVPSINVLFGSSGEETPAATKPFSNINGDSQVLTVLVSPLLYNSNTASTTFFLGYASGRVQAVKVVREGGRYSYEVVSQASAHTDEVTALTILPLDRPCVASSSVDGTVMIYPESLSKNTSLENATLAFRASDTPAKILCVAGMQNVMCTGDDMGRLTLWSLHRDSAVDNEPCWSEMNSISVEVGGSMPTLIQVHNEVRKTIVVGTNSGGLFTFRVNMVEGEYALVSLHSAPTAHIGAVESMKIVGNILLTSAAHEGHVRGWDIRTLSPLGLIAVHPGRSYQPRQPGRSLISLKCAVMGTIVWHERESLVSLCRDGTIREYSYAPQVATEMSTPQNALEATAPLRSFMAEADDAMCTRMRMSIIQASLQSKKATTLPFLGADGVQYKDTKASFDNFSGILPCIYCQQIGNGVS